MTDAFGGWVPIIKAGDGPVKGTYDQGCSVAEGGMEPTAALAARASGPASPPIPRSWCPLMLKFVSQLKSVLLPLF
jgi:hypothetical protein